MNAASRMEDFADAFDPFTALLTLGGEGHIHDPYPELARLREAAPVHPMDLHTHLGAPKHVTIGDRPCYTILGWKEVSHVLATPEDFSNRVYESNLGITFGKTITAMDAPLHAKYRRLLMAAFSPRALDSYRSMFQRCIDRLIDGFISRGRADLVQEFALHFPFQFVMDLMDMDVQQRPVFHKMAVAQMCVTFDRDHGVQASRILGAFLGDLVDMRRQMRSDTDFVSVIANAQVDGEQLPQEIVVSFLRQLMNAGGDTSYHGFSSQLSALLTHPDQLDMVRRDRSLIDAAIDEALRWNGPLCAINRTPTRDLVLGGVPMPRDAYLHVCIGAANRDDKIWPDPERFDITRPRQRPLAFGYGPHVCIGMHVARMELTMAMNTLLDRLPGLRLDPDKPPPAIRGLTLRGAEHVHVVFDRSAAVPPKPAAKEAGIQGARHERHR